MNNTFDLVIVGGGIVGLASALAGRKKGLSVAVIERNARNIGASIRNFGFVTISGQRAGKHWQRAMRSRDVWAEVAPQAGIDISHHGLYMPTQRPEATATAEAFLQTDMGADCRFLTADEVAEKLPFIGKHEKVLYSPHELRVESKDAIEQLSQWLEKNQAVTFFRNTSVTAINMPNIHTSRGIISAKKCVVCPGNDFTSLYPETIAKANAKQCTLQMLRVMPDQDISLPGAIMSDQSYARYDGFAHLPEGQALGQLLDNIQPAHRKAGVHLIIVQSADGSLIVGDSHVYDEVEQPFRDSKIDELILDELKTIMPNMNFKVMEHWIGVYASADDVVFIDTPEPNVVVGLVTGGTGASTGFAFAEELIDHVLSA